MKMNDKISEYKFVISTLIFEYTVLWPSASEQY